MKMELVPFEMGECVGKEIWEINCRRMRDDGKLGTSLSLSLSLFLQRNDEWVIERRKRKVKEVIER